MTVKNTGTLAWNRSPDGQGRYFVLGYHWNGPEVRHAGADGALGQLAQDVPPGGTAQVAVALQVPATAGTYTLQWDMVHLGATWFTGCCGVTGASPPAPNQGAIQTVGVGGGSITFIPNPGTLQALCQVVGCDKPNLALNDAAKLKLGCAFASPHVEIVFGARTQGGTTMMGGRCFGATKGDVQANIDGQGWRSLEILQWSQNGKGVIFKFPTNTAVPGPVSLQLKLKRADGKEVSVSDTYTPTMTVVKVSPPGIRLYSCSSAAVSNNCHESGTGRHSTCEPPYMAPPWSGCTVQGQDCFNLDLKNGYRVQSTQTNVDVSAAGEAGANVNQAKTGALAGKSSASICVPWHTTQWDWVEYEFDIWAEGAINLEP